MPDQGDVNLVKSTFKMNPFLEESIVKELESYEFTDPDAYLVYNLGEWAKLTGLVYPKWDYFDVEEPEGKTAYGLDFGFNHATALIKVTKTEDRKLYWDQIIYETEITPSDIIGLLKDMKFSKRWLILADESRPDSIEEIRRAGYKIKKSKKGKVFTGITAIKKYKLFLRGEKLISEAKMYRWKEDTDKESEDRQKLVDEPVKRFDDAMDAARYGSGKLIRAVTFKF
jgi:phage terminase large subunit